MKDIFFVMFLIAAIWFLGEIGYAKFKQGKDLNELPWQAYVILAIIAVWFMAKTAFFVMGEPF